VRFLKWTGVHPVAVVLVIAATIAVMVAITSDDEPSGAPMTFPDDPATESPGPGRSISDPDLAGWKHSGEGRFDAAARNGDVVYTSRGGPGVLWFDEEFGDFQLTLQFKVDGPSGDSGVYMRLPSPEDFSTVGDGVEIQISVDGVGDEGTGAIYKTEDPLVFFAPTPDEWHEMTVRAEGMRVLVSFDGILVTQFPTTTDPGALDWGPTGFIGLQNLSKSDIVRFRDIRISQL
jgi:cytochrome c